MLQKSTFEIETESSFVGYFDPSYVWNGFRAPAFEKDVAMAIIAEINSAEAPQRLFYDAESDRFVDDSQIIDYGEDGEQLYYEAQEIETVDGVKTLYFIGDCWTWSEANS